MHRPNQLQLATLVDAPPEGDGWVHELKFDGYRILAELERGRVHLWSRRFHDWTAQFPTIAEAIAELSVERALIDGEACVVEPDGRTSFQALQNALGTRSSALGTRSSALGTRSSALGTRSSALGTRSSALAYFAFDLLAEGDDDLTRLPLEQRKARLHALVPHTTGTLRFSDHVIGGGEAFFRLACARGLEGIVSKRRDAHYTPGRGAAWQKTKCLLRQELVIGGFTEPEGSRAHLGALLVGYHEAGALIYAGKVGTGFTQKMLAELRAALDPLATTRCPFTPEPPRAWTGGARHWVRAQLVAEVAFSEWTNDDRLRHPSFQGLRTDKRAADVIRERPVHGAR